MALYLKDVQINNCWTGISAPSDVTIHADGLQISNTKQAIELRDPLSLFKLGLPQDTPPEYLLEVIKSLESIPGASREQQIKTIEESKLATWLGVTADLAGLTMNFMSLLKL